MTKLYRFSPIKNEKMLKKVYGYIATELEKLSIKIFSHSLPITTLKAFSHYPEEYDYLHKLVQNMGPEASFNSQTSFYAKTGVGIKGYPISYLGIRIPDPYRLHVGCGDFEIDNFDDFRKKYPGMSPFVRDFNGMPNMLEVWHPDFDVLGYILPQRK